MEKLTVYVGENMDGVIFEMPLRESEALKKEFPNAMPAKKLFVGYGIGYDEKVVMEKIKQFVVPAMTGLDGESLKRILRVVFYDPFNRKELFTIEHN